MQSFYVGTEGPSADLELAGAVVGVATATLPTPCAEHSPWWPMLRQEKWGKLGKFKAQRRDSPSNLLGCWAKEHQGLLVPRADANEQGLVDGCWPTERLKIMIGQ